MPLWNPWHGCTKCSTGCRNCYVYRRDAEFGKDASVVRKTASFDLPIKRDRKGNYKLKPEDGTVMTVRGKLILQPAVRSFFSAW